MCCGKKLPEGSTARKLCDLDADARREYWACLALRHCHGLGARSVCCLLQHFGSAYAAVQGQAHWREAGLRSDMAQVLASNAWRTSARIEWDRACSLNAFVVFWKDPAYPPLLRRIVDAPPLLYCRGDISLLQTPCFAVVGARKATEHGLTVAKHMAHCLAAYGLTIVSGMALGIDRIAHEAALHGVGRSIGVLGTGIDMAYPRQNMSLFEAMESSGLLVSEFAPGTPPQACNFPIRNRIISGLSLGVLVVEAADRSGSLITARLALEQNRDVYAVPGPALDVHCLGSQELVRQGAQAVFCAEDILRDLAEQLRHYGISMANLSQKMKEASGVGRHISATEYDTKNAAGSYVQQPKDDRRPAATLPSGELAAVQQLTASDDTATILRYLCVNGPTQSDVLANAAGLSASATNPVLIGLEMLGQVRRLPGARYEAVT